VIYSHSQHDHYGRPRAWSTRRTCARGRVPVSRPAGFMEEVAPRTCSPAPHDPSRRSSSFARTLPGARAARWTPASARDLARHRQLDPAHVSVVEPFETHRLDGVEIGSGHPGHGAPAEMHMFYPELRALNLAETPPQPAQHLPHPRDPRCATPMPGEVPRRGAGNPLRPRRRRGLRPTSLAVWGRAPLEDFLRKAARSVQVPPRQRPPHEPWYRAAEIGSGSRCPGAWRARCTCAATTAPSATTRRRLYQRYLAGTTPIRPASIPAAGAAGAEVRRYMGGDAPRWRGAGGLRARETGSWRR